MEDPLVGGACPQTNVLHSAVTLWRRCNYYVELMLRFAEDNSVHLPAPVPTVFLLCVLPAYFPFPITNFCIFLLFTLPPLFIPLFIHIYSSFSFIYFSSSLSLFPFFLSLPFLSRSLFSSILFHLLTSYFLSFPLFYFCPFFIPVFSLFLEYVICIVFL